MADERMDFIPIEIKPLPEDNCVELNKDYTGTIWPLPELYDHYRNYMAATGTIRPPGIK
jgi:hypothetical protein